VTAAAQERDKQQGVQRAQPGHALPGEVGAQPLRACARKKLDKRGYGLSCLTGKRDTHGPILPV
jgi:hypothetical protein